MLSHRIIIRNSILRLTGVSFVIYPICLTAFCDYVKSAKDY